MKDLYSVCSDFLNKRMIAESQKYDGGNEFNHLEQAIFASKELENSLRSLQELNPGKYEKYGDTIKKIKEVNKEFPPMLDSLKGQMDSDNIDSDEKWWDEEDEEDSEEDFGEDDDLGEDEESEDDEGDGFPFEEEDEEDDEPPFEGQDAMGDDEEF